MADSIQELKSKLQAAEDELTKATSERNKARDKLRLSALEKAAENADNALEAAEESLSAAYDRAVAKLIGVRNDKTEVGERLRCLAGKWAGFTEEELRENRDAHGDILLASSAAYELTKLLHDAVRKDPSVDKMEQQFSKLEKAADKAYEAVRKTELKLGTFDDRVYDAQKLARDLRHQLYAAEQRKETREARKKKNRTRKDDDRCKEGRQKLRELVDFGVGRGFNRTEHRDLQKKRKQSLKRFLKKELGL